MPVKLIFLIRHAQPDYPGGKMMCLGRKNDLPLSALGRKQAEALGRWFNHLPLEAVYASPLLRARETALAVAGGRPVHILPELIEMDGGEWDGLTFDELHERYPSYFGKGRQASCPPGGETDAQGLARAHTALEYVAAHTEHCAAIVAHSGVNRILLCDLLGKPLHEKKRIPQDCGAINILEYHDGKWHAQTVNLMPANMQQSETPESAKPTGNDFLS